MDFIHDLKSVVPYGRSRFGRKCQNSEGSLILHFCRHRHREEQKEGGGGNYGVSALRGGFNYGTSTTHGARVSEVPLPRLQATLQ